MKIISPLLFLTLLLICSSCNKDDDDQVVNLPDLNSILENANLEDGIGNTPTNWWNFPADYTIKWTSDEAFSGSRAISITGDGQSENFGYWAQTINAPIEVGKELTVKMQVKSDMVDGGGVSIAIRADNTPQPESQAEQFNSTQSSMFIGGTHDWKEISVDLPEALDVETKSITVYLIMLAETSGTIYFDDIVLEYK